MRALTDPCGFFAVLNYQMDYAVFSGEPSSYPIADMLSRCCMSDSYIKREDYYAGIPSCSSCHRTLGPDDLVRVPRAKGKRIKSLPVTP